MEADDSQLIRGYPHNVSVSGQQLLLTDTQLQIKQILMCVCGGGGGGVQQSAGRGNKQAGGLRSALAKPPPFGRASRNASRS